jgi:hypothetical protein
MQVIIPDTSELNSHFYVSNEQVKWEYLFEDRHCNEELSEELFYAFCCNEELSEEGTREF